MATASAPASASASCPSLPMQSPARKRKAALEGIPNISAKRNYQNAERHGSCPYAVDLEDDEQGSVEGMLSQAKKQCPAFSQGDCPFKTAKNTLDVRQTLAQVPPSHYKEDYFKQALQHIHTINVDVAEEFKISECPVQSYISDEQISFGHAMEEFSLAAIMSRLVSDLEGPAEEQDHENHHHDQTTQIQASMKETAMVPLSQAFKKGTAVAHQAAEDVHFVKNFIRGKIDRSLYAELVLSMYHVYQKMEDLLEEHASSHFSTCHFPKQLGRTAALEEDLDFWFGEIPTRRSPATQDYLNRLDDIGRTNPILLLSHAYTRYLGDLSGGKVLERVARRALDLGPDGLQFYKFEHVTSAKKFKDQYRRCLDDLNLTKTEIQDLVQEANIAFLLNMRLFEELDVKANVPGATVRDLAETLSFSTHGKVAASDECPFLKQKDLTKKAGRCPWPFVFMHDPATGMQDYQTWIVLGLVLCWIWAKLQN